MGEYTLGQSAPGCRTGNRRAGAQEQEQVLSGEEEEVALLVQPLRKLAQPASGQLGIHHLHEAGAVQEEQGTWEHRAEEEQGKERSGDQSGPHHVELKLGPASSAQPLSQEQPVPCRE